MGCDLITNGRCKYESEDGCTALCGGERPYGTELCELEELEWKDPTQFEFDEEGIVDFLKEFSNAIKSKRSS